MAHNPAYFEEYVSWGADLHFQAIYTEELFEFLLGGLFSPEKIFFPKYDALFESGDSRMIVNRGLDIQN